MGCKVNCSSKGKRIIKMENNEIVKEAGLVSYLREIS